MDKVGNSIIQRLELIKTKMQEKKQNKNIGWCLTLFGTAVGAGMLFLPVRAGISGIWAIIIASLIIGPMTYYAHRCLARFILSSKKENNDFVGVIGEYFGEKARDLTAFMYFLAFYPVLLIYGLSLTNTIDSFFINQLNLVTTNEAANITSGIIPRWLIALISIFSMVYVMTKSKEKIIKITSAIVYPLAIMLFGISVYLMRYWQLDNQDFSAPEIGDLLGNVWLTLPILVFSFNYSPTVSEFAISMKESYKDKAEIQSSNILRATCIMLWLFTMFFVFSCILSLSPNEIVEAEQQNISILSYLANTYQNPAISFIGPLIGSVAIISSFFGHYLGAVEGIKGLIVKRIDDLNAKKEKKLDNLLAVFVATSTWIVTLINPSVLNIIENIGTPIIAIMLYLIPMYGVYKVDALKKYRNSINNILIIITGVLTTTALIYNML